MTKRDAAVIGAGPAGLAVAAELGRRGVDAVVIERADAVGSSWRSHYDRRHLHTVRWLSGLPRMRIPRSYGRWVSRDGVIEYLEEYARRFSLDLMLDCEVSGVTRDPGGGWVLDTSRGPVAARW